MRQVITILLIFVCHIFTIAQTIVNRVFERTDIHYFHLDKIEIGKETVLFCSLSLPYETWANISPNTFIEEISSKKKYRIIRSEGLPFSPQKRDLVEGAKVNVRLVFPKLPLSSKINLIENPSGDGFNIYGISLSESYENTYTENDYAHFKQQADYWTTIGDSTRAIINKQKQIESSKYLLGCESNLYLSEMYELSDLYIKFGNANKSIFWKENMAQVCRNICRDINSNDNESKKGYYLSDVDMFYENQLCAYRFYYDSKKWKDAENLMEDVHDILIEKYDTAIYIPIVEYCIGVSSYYAKNEKNAEKFLLMSYNSFQRHLELKKYPVYGELLGRLGLLYNVKGNNELAYKYAKEACSTFQNILGEDSKEYGFALAGLANAEMMLNRKQECLSHAEQASNIIERASDVPHEIKELYRERINVIRNVLKGGGNVKTGAHINDNTDNSAVAIMEANNAILQGQFDIAISKLKEIKVYIENNFESVELHNYIDVVVPLSTVLSQTGKLAEADRVIDDAIKICEENHVTSDLIRHLYASKGQLCFLLNDNLSAIQWYQQSLDIFRKVNDKSISYARLLSNISLIAIQVKSYDKAKNFLDEAMEICSNFYKKDTNTTNDYLMLLNNLATNYAKSGNIDRGIDIYTLVLNRATSPNFQRIKGLTMNSLAELYLQNNEFARARELLEGVISMNVEGYVKEMAESNLLLCQILQKDLTAVKKIKEFNNSSNEKLAKVFGRFSESERERYWEFCSSLLVVLNNFSAMTFNTPETNYIAYDNALYTKGMLIKSERLLGNLVKTSSNDKTNEMFEKMLDYREKLSNKNTAQDSIEFYKNKIIQLEKSIVSSIPHFSEELKKQFETCVDIKNSLADNEVAIEFVFLPNIHFPSEKTELVYGALILTRHEDYPRLVSLCSEKELESVLMGPASSNSYIDSLYNINNNTLYRMLWEKLENYIPKGSTIFYSPTGSISKINLAAISQGTNRLLELYTIKEVSTTAVLAHHGQNLRRESCKAVVYGDINYFEDVETMASHSNGYVSNSSGPLLATRSAIRNAWDMLPATKEEISQICKALEENGVHTQIYTQNYANEESFKALDRQAPNIIHIATHGFYFPNKSNKSNFFNGRESNTSNNSHLLYSGLIFAGANNVWNGNTIAKGIEDGILTADEISRIDLTGNSLVVLSACETGLGDIDKVNGVYGLQRGLKKAGVETILMSLWKVDDEATKILMVEFYKNLMSGKPKHQSLQDAQQYLRKFENGKYDNPKYWASFIMLDGLN